MDRIAKAAFGVAFSGYGALAVVGGLAACADARAQEIARELDDGEHYVPTVAVPTDTAVAVHTPLGTIPIELSDVSWPVASIFICWQVIRFLEKRGPFKLPEFHVHVHHRTGTADDTDSFRLVRADTAEG